MADMIFGMTPTEAEARYSGQQPAASPSFLSKLTSYIPNVMTVPETYQGLLGTQETAALQRQANIQGLLGAAAALSEGMSRTGPRRSALQNILSAAAAGYGSAGSAMEQGLKNYQTRLQLTQSTANQEAINRLLQDPRIAKDPMMVAYVRSNPAEAIKFLSENIPLQEAITGKPYSVSGTPESVAVTPAAPAAAPVPQVPGQEAQMPTVGVTAPSVERNLQSQKNLLIAQNERLGMLPGKTAQDRIKSNLEQIAAIDKQLDRTAVSGFDFTQYENTFPDQFKPRVRSLKQAAETGSLTMADLTQRLQEIEKDANAFVMKKVDFTNESRALFGAMFRNPDGSPRAMETATASELMAFANEKQRREKELRKSGATQVNVGDRTLAAERAKQQAAAEENAINSMNSAADVRAIVDILKPYKGGRIDEFKSDLGAYMPGTSLAQVTTANQLATSIVNRIAPTLRVPGSGATSDFDANMFLNSIPRLITYAEGRELMAVYAEKLANRNAAIADIRARLTDSGEFSVARMKQEIKNAGLDRIFTNEEIQTLRNAKAPAASQPQLTVPGAQSAYEKYKPK